ncbi:MAG: NAD(P)/FAD-dependent oxidoreductase [Myxococcota bacterium]
MTHTQLAIIGGGPAGMAATLVAGRARLNALLLDANDPRNAVAHASHGFLTRDGAHASELHDIAQAQLHKYPTVRTVAERVEDVVPTDGGFRLVTTAGHERLAERVVFATGFRTDLRPVGIENIEAVYGCTVFPCPFCDGFEFSDRRVAVFASVAAAHMGPLLRMWSSDVIVFTNGHPLTPEDREQLDARAIPIEDAPIDRLEHREGKMSRVVLADGRSVARDVGFLGEPHAELGTDLPARLGVPTALHPFMGAEHYEADDFGKTAVDGVYVVGDLKRVFGGITAAAHDGYMCVAGIVNELAHRSDAPTPS